MAPKARRGARRDWDCNSGGFGLATRRGLWQSLSLGRSARLRAISGSRPRGGASRPKQHSERCISKGLFLEGKGHSPAQCGPYRALFDSRSRAIRACSAMHVSRRMWASGLCPLRTYDTSARARRERPPEVGASPSLPHPHRASSALLTPARPPARLVPSHHPPLPPLPFRLQPLGRLPLFITLPPWPGARGVVWR